MICWASPLKVSDTPVLRWGPIIFISNKFPGGTNVDGPVATFKNCYFMKIQNKEGLLLAGEIKKVHEEYSLFSACA